MRINEVFRVTEVCELQSVVSSVNRSSGLHQPVKCRASGVPLDKGAIELAGSEMGCFQQVDEQPVLLNRLP